MSSTSTIDYPTVTKRGFLLGLALFVVGGTGQILVHGLGLQLPGWETMILFDLEVLGVVLALLVPLVFGIVLPLVE